MEKVIFAELAATVHVLSGDVEKDANGKIINEPYESRVMTPGETLQLTDVPSYLREAVEKGEAPGLTLLTPAAAKKLNDQAAKIRAVAEQTNVLPALSNDEEPIHAPEVEAGVSSLSLYALDE